MTLIIATAAACRACAEVAHSLHLERSHEAATTIPLCTLAKRDLRGASQQETYPKLLAPRPGPRGGESAGSLLASSCPPCLPTFIPKAPPHSRPLPLAEYLAREAQFVVTIGNVRGVLDTSVLDPEPGPHGPFITYSYYVTYGFMEDEKSEGSGDVEVLAEVCAPPQGSTGCPSQAERLPEAQESPGRGLADAGRMGVGTWLARGPFLVAGVTPSRAHASVPWKREQSDGGSSPGLHREAGCSQPRPHPSSHPEGANAREPLSHSSWGVFALGIDLPEDRRLVFSLSFGNFRPPEFTCGPALHSPSNACTLPR